MSLLLKALKQAEAAEKAPVDSPAPADRRDPDLNLEPLTPHAQAHEWVEPPGLLFGSGGLPPAAAPRESGFQLPALSLVSATALLAVLISVAYGIYLYFELRPAPLVVVPAPVSAQAPAPPQPDTMAFRPPSPAMPQAEPAPTPANPALPVTSPPPAAPSSARVRTAHAGTGNAPDIERPVESPRSASIPAFQPDPHSTTLTRAYAAYQSGNLDEALRLYSQAATGGRSIDALLGLAAIASVQNREAEALRLYRQVLDLEPSHPVAHAALLEQVGHTDAQATESRLKTLIDRAPSPALYQTLGNLYADQRRWGDAQVAYFEAYRGAPGNADYAFNLAVSLDQLRQYPAARSYYEKALALGGVHRFDRTQAEVRVQQLQSLR